MKSINPYITFEGNCEEAFNFYKSVFGGNFSHFARFNEMPPQEGMPVMPEEFGKRVMHVSLPLGDSVLMGSDNAGDFGPKLVKGNNITVSINATDRKEADRLFKELSEAGCVIMPIGEVFWGSYYGMFTDKFGINWMISAN